MQRENTIIFEQFRREIVISLGEIARIRQESPPSASAKLRVDVHLGRIERFLRQLQDVDPARAADLQIAICLSKSVVEFREKTMSTSADHLHMIRAAQSRAAVDPAELLLVLRDLAHAVEIAEDNNWSASSRRLISAAADRAADISFRAPRN